jgi:NAD(P)-dependent dehydrogenase (short-subunit alcohol dehydrogenase family)
MDLHLKEKVVVITGGGTGIGKGLVKEFLEEGAQVCILGRRINPLVALHDEMALKGYDIFYRSCDVTNRQAVVAYVDEVLEKYGHLDVWINNAGIGINKKFMEFTDEDFDQIFATNLKAVFQCTQIAATAMMRQRKGVILNASSFNSKLAHANGVLYAATKAGVSSLTKSTAAALAPYGIRVLGYLPGMIVTPISEENVAKYKDKFIHDIALGRLGYPEDLAKPIAFLASDCASYMTGVDVEISGGKFAVQDCTLAWKFKEEEQK